MESREWKAGCERGEGEPHCLPKSLKIWSKKNFGHFWTVLSVCHSFKDNPDCSQGSF